MKRTILALAIAGLSVAAYAAPPPGGGPPTPLNVNVTNPVLQVEVSNSEPISVVVSGDAAPIAYFYSNKPTCAFANVCEVAFPAIPAGKRLRLTSISSLFIGTNVTGHVAIGKASNAPLLAFPAVPFSGAYYGTLVSVNEHVEIYFEAGETPVVEFGIPAGSGGINDHPNNRLTVAGELVDAGS